MNARRLAALGLAGLLGACASEPEVVVQQQQPQEIKYKPEDASRIYMEKGVRYMESGSYEIALKDMQRAIELDDENSEAYNAIGVLYERIDDFPNAERSYKKALSIQSDNYRARNNYARFLCSRGRANEAFEEFAKIIGNKLYDQPWVALTNAGVCAHGQGKRAEAENYMRKALEVAPNFAPALLEMARLSRESNQLMSARAFLERYFSAAGPSPDALKLGIEIENGLGNPDAAEEYARMLRGRFPGSK